VSFRLKKDDREILRLLAEYRLLMVPQMLALCGGVTSKSSIRRRLAQLTHEGLIESFDRGFGKKRGRPEKVFTIGRSGVEVLVAEKILNEDANYESINGCKIHCLNHQLLLNWFSIHVSHLAKVIPCVSSTILTPTTTFFEQTNGKSFTIGDSVVVPKTRKPIHFVPDAVFKITDNERDKSLLFFLEVDMGTETVASPNRKKNDVRQKIVNPHSDPSFIT
jgi:hypothetical protein